MSEPRDLPAWLRYIEIQHPKTMDLGLERVRIVAERLDVVQPAPVVVTVAGTNGKGTTAVCLEALLRRQGTRVGTTLSPHVGRFNERVRIDGVEAADEVLCECFAAVEAARGDVPLTYFEFSALLALLAFQRAGVEVAILEIGLGGRLDAFNLVDADVAVVTSIGLDHQEYLGTTRDAIGAEKAGIFRADQHIVLGPDLPATVLAPAHRLGRRVLASGEAFHVDLQDHHWSLGSGGGMPDGLCYEALPYSTFPVTSCALGLLALVALRERFDRWQLPEQAALARLLQRLSLPGRFEQFDCAGRRLIVDVGHNPLAADYLRARIDRDFPDARVVALCGMLADKDAAAVLSALAPRVEHWLFVPTSGPRGQSAAALAARLPAGQAHGLAAAPAAALEQLRSLTAPGDVILAFGSFLLVQQLRDALQAPDSMWIVPHE